MSLVDLRWLDAAFFASVILTYMSGVAAYRLIDIRRRSKLTLSAVAPVVSGGPISCTLPAPPHTTLSPLTATSPQVLAVFAMADLLLWHHGASRWPMLLLSVAFGLVNAVSAEAGGGMRHTGI